MYHMQMRLSLTWQVSIAVALALANVFIFQAVFATPALTVTIAAAGKGSVAIVRIPSGQTILVDTGSDASVLRALGTTLPPWQRHLEAVILTSDKAAQAGGLPSVTARYHVSEVIHLGTAASPYGAPLTFDSATITTLAPGVSTLTTSTAAFTISSSTTPSTYFFH